MRSKTISSAHIYIKAALLIVVCAAAIIGCVFKEKPEIYEKRPIVFTHYTHVVKEKWKCDACHKDYQTSEKAGMADPRICRKCHQTQEEIDKYLKPFAPNRKLTWSTITDLPDEIIFSHKLHYDAKIPCDDCHKGLIKKKQIDYSSIVSKDDCIKCHVKEKVTGDCKSCHKTIDADWQPPDHASLWSIKHGQAARGGLDWAYKNRCSYCHEDSTCVKCHEEQKPSDHTATWKYERHGLAAGMDRDRCAACHNAYTCVACHKESSPRSHIAGFGRPRNNHCASCHFPVEAQGCGACHERLNGHLTATPMPQSPSHATAGSYECRTCHNKLNNISHVDNGDDCRSCHF